MSLVLTQLLNGIQLGSLLFLLSAGLTLVFGIMNFINLMHGSLFMMGAYFAASTFSATGSFSIAMLAGIGGAALLGVVVERLVVAHMYERSHLHQVLVTFGLVLFFNELARIFWGSTSIHAGSPGTFSGAVEIFGSPYPSYRILIIAVSLAVAAGLYFFIKHTRLGMLVRASASRSDIASALGVNVVMLKRCLFAFGAALAGLAGVMAGPITSVQPGMGEPILIMTLVVIVTGGIGSVRGAFFSAMVIGVADTVGRIYIPMLLRATFERSTAQAIGPALASIMIYLLMACVLALRPQGLFPVRHG